jgi:hypothetical protein
MGTVSGGPRSPKEILGNSLNIWYDLSKPIYSSDQINANTFNVTDNLTISRLYDFSGNNKHATQANKSQQFAYIPNSLNGFAATTSSAATNMGMSINGTLTTGPRSFFIVGKDASTGFVFWDRGGATPGSLQIGISGINGWNDSQQDIGVIGISGGVGSTPYVMSYIFDSNQTYLYRNGNQNRVANANLFTLNGNNVSLFSRYLGGTTYDQRQAGTMYEMIFVSKVPSIGEYNSIITYLSAKWKIAAGPISSY